MKQIPLGNTGIYVTPLALGCATFGREIDEDRSFQILDYAVEKGINFLDTAESYGGGQSFAYREKSLGIREQREVSNEISSSELIIGRWLKSRNCRDAVTICTKVSTGAKDTNINKALNGSLERLSIDCVDIYELHSPDPETSIVETLQALTSHISAGRIKFAGCSNFSTDQLNAALLASETSGLCRFQVVQLPYNLLQPDAQDTLFPLCKRKNIAITTYSPLAAGFLTGKYVSDPTLIPKHSRFGIMPAHTDIYFSDKNFTLVEKLRQISALWKTPMATLALAWVMNQPDITSVLIGARSIDHIDQAFAAYELKLDPMITQEMTHIISENAKIL